jgi:hypothetical protein
MKQHDILAKVLVTYPEVQRMNVSVEQVVAVLDAYTAFKAEVDDDA